MKQFRTNRGLFKWIILTIITFGIYDLVMMYHISSELNEVAKKDGKKTMNYLLLFFILTPITFGIATLVWWHRICARMGNELDRRGIDYGFGAGSFWGWNIFGVLLFGLGPFIFKYKFLKTMNLLNADYNAGGSSSYSSSSGSSISSSRSGGKREEAYDDLMDKI